MSMIKKMDEIGSDLESNVNPFTRESDTSLTFYIPWQINVHGHLSTCVY